MKRQRKRKGGSAVPTRSARTASHRGKAAPRKSKAKRGGSSGRPPEAKRPAAAGSGRGAKPSAAATPARGARRAPVSESALHWEERSQTEIERLLAAGAIALLPVGAIEPHGPHLPLATDVIIATEMARRAALRLERSGTACLLLPPLAWSVADWSAGFAGRISLSGGTARSLLVEILTGARTAGARLVAVANAHLEPAHMSCVRDACAEVGRTGAPPVFPDLTRRALAEQLGEAFGKGDHGGRFETSLVMAARPDLVNDAVRRALPPVATGLVERIRSGAVSFRQTGMEAAYCGDPASASAREGRHLFDLLAGILESAVRDAMAGPSRGGSRS